MEFEIVGDSESFDRSFNILKVFLPCDSTDKTEISESSATHKVGNEDRKKKIKKLKNTAKSPTDANAGTRTIMLLKDSVDKN